MSTTPELGALGQLEPAGDRWQLRFTRHLPHPPEKVWRAVTEPEHLVAWFPTTIDGDRATGAALAFSFPHEDAPAIRSTARPSAPTPPPSARPTGTPTPDPPAEPDTDDTPAIVAGVSWRSREPRVAPGVTGRRWRRTSGPTARRTRR